MERLGRLAALIAQSTGAGDGIYETAIKDVYFSRYSNAEGARSSIDRAVMCVVAQGAKAILVNGARHVYDSSRYLVVPLALPLVGEVVNASPEKPFLGVSIVLDYSVIGALLLESGPATADERADGRSHFVSPMDDDMFDAVFRLAVLAGKPKDIAVLAPLLRREISYRLLQGENGWMLQRMTTADGHARRIVAGLEYLKRNAARTVRMGELAREMNMSTSAMHYWFRTVTSMSPVQFQKQLRLQEARRILLSESSDAASAGHRVGYESPSHFSREYRRLFGLPPLQDIERLRGGADASVPIQKFAP